MAHNPVRTVSYLSLSLREENASFNCWLTTSLARIRELLFFSCREEDDDGDDGDDDDDDDDGGGDCRGEEYDDGVTNANAW